jgi:small subunit ribosomal protein S24
MNFLLKKLQTVSLTCNAVINPVRSLYTFNLKGNSIRYRRSTRPKKTSNESLSLTYEQAQFVEKIGVTKSWNSWNTSNLLDGKRQSETIADDLLVRKFIYGTFHSFLSSEIIIKRRLNTINIGFLTNLGHRGERSKIYFLVGYSEELLSSLLKCVVKVQVQSIYNKEDLIFRTW